jgi:hypothetical protein
MSYAALWPGETGSYLGSRANAKKAVFPSFHMGILTDIGQSV